MDIDWLKTLPPDLQDAVLADWKRYPHDIPLEDWLELTHTSDSAPSIKRVALYLMGKPY